jgi:hypothetical protein
MSLQERSITAENQFTDAVAHSSSEGDIALSISGTFVATVTLQRSLDQGETWTDDDNTYTAPTEQNIPPTEGALYQAGVKTGDFTSGTVEVKLL